jgi:hypothetical protein
MAGAGSALASRIDAFELGEAFMNRVLRRAVSAIGALLATGLLGAQSFAATLTTNSDPTASLYAGVRYRNLLGSGPGGAAEVQVFSSPCCGAATNGQFAWALPQAVSIVYGGGNLSTTVGAVTTTRAVGNLGDLNYIQLQITKNGSTTSVALNNISLNGGASLGSILVNAAPNTRVWKITGDDLSAGFTLTGTLATSGLMGGGDSNFVQVEVGFVEPPDTDGPITSSVMTSPVPALLNGMVTVTANVSDETTGNNNVASAEYQIDGGVWQPMSSSDGAFDEPNEDVEATFTATSVGTHEVCVRGTDSVGNTGDAACQMFLVTYKFTGFFSPIDNDAVNMVKAGQAVPAKWRLTDANDIPIADPSSFVSLSSYPISCVDFSGDPVDSVEEVAAGMSGLQYNGDGYWQFNWKTLKSYADTCRAMYVEFDSGAISPVVKFRFKK